ncbi:MAG: glycosyltransferase family 87 protein [Marinoscillum sp.]
MPKQDKTAVFAAGFIFFAGISATGLLIPRHHGWMLLFAYFSAFFAYIWLCKSEIKLTHLLAIGVTARLILFLGLPSLSDDLYRFIWDGALLREGFSPYAGLPAEYLSLGIPGVDQKLYDQLNSQPYYSVYPPLNQLLFWISTTIGTTWLTQANLLRCFFLMADLGSVYFLRQLLSHQKNHSVIGWFFLNPLLILEATGNIHFEGLVVFFILLGLYTLEKNRTISSGIGFGLAAATKLLPLIFLPAILMKKWLKEGATVTIVAGLVVSISLIPFVNSALLSGMQSSLGLYFQKFEFNASVYFLLREAGFWFRGYNIIGTLGPTLSVLTLLGVLGLALNGQRRKWPLSKTMLFSLSLYLLLATTVHPWYILPLIALGLLSGFYYPIVWSLMIFVTYFGYQEAGFELSTLWIVLEYGVVLSTFAIELIRSHEKST